MSENDAFARLSKVTATYAGAKALDTVNLDLPAGKVIAFCGPNGSGKSTALRTLRGLHAPDQGHIEVIGQLIETWRPKALAREIAMLSQSPSAPMDMTVADLVMLGRYAHRGRFSVTTQADHTAVTRALSATNLTDFSNRRLGQLSGGQAQRAWIAMVLAQDAPHIFLDEPTNHLDIAHALDILELVSDLNRNAERDFVIVLHDLNHAMRYADEVVLFDKGCIAAAGPTQEVLTEPMIRQVFDIDCRIIQIDAATRPVVVPLSRASTTSAPQTVVHAAIL